MSVESSESGSVESSTESGTTGSSSRRARFREWRNRRPFAGGVLLCLAGVLIAYVPLQFAFELLLIGGSYTYIGLVWAAGVFLSGAFALYRPDLSTIFGVIGVVFSILSLLGALGGLLIGMIVGIIGGNLCVAWQRPDAVAGGEGGRGGPGDDRPVRTDGGEPSDARRPSSALRSDGGRPVDDDVGPSVEDDDRVAAGSLARVQSALADVVSPREAEIAGAVAADLRGLAREARELAARPPRDPLGVPRAAPGRLVDAATGGGPSKRLAVTVAVLVVTSGTLTLVTAIPAAAILGDQEETTYTVDVGEIRLGEDGRICAASVGSDTYRVTITNATLVDATIYQQRGDDAVKTDFPSVQVDDTMVMYTRGGDEQFDLLATTVGCTDEDQTSRTVFRNRYQTSELLRGSDGVTMLNMEATDATVPEPGGFQFVAPEDDNASSPAPNVTNVTGVADGIDDVVDGDLVDRLTNDTDDLDPVGEAVGEVDDTAENATGGAGPDDAVENATGDVVSSAEESVDNTTGEATETDPPENGSGAVDDTTDTVDNTTGEVTGTVNDTTDAVDETVNGTDGTTNATDEVTGTVDETTDEATDGVDDTVEGTVGTVEETATSTPTDDGASTTPTATPEGSDRPAWLDQVDDEEAVLETIEETEGDVDDVENVTSEAEPLDEETIEADDNLTRLDNGTVLLLNGTDPADIEWASDLLEEPDASSVGTETVTTTPDDEESEAESDDSVLGAAG